MRQGHVGGVDFAQGAWHVGVHGAVLLPATHAHHRVAGLEFGVTAVHHLADGAADHDLTQGLRHCVAFAFVHAAAHVGVEAQVMVAHQHFAVFQFRQWQFDHFEILSSGFALWAVVQNDAVVDGHKSLLLIGV